MTTTASQPDELRCTAAEFVTQHTAAETLEQYHAVHRAGDHRRISVPIDPIVRTINEHDTIKFVVRLEDELETESVILPYQGSTGRQRNTLCVSSQVGCAMGCTFCETAQMGLMRNLTTREIVQQWWAARHELGYSIDNIVFMGMGEPLDNVQSVFQAIRVLTDHDGPAIAASRITVSTVGRVGGIRALKHFASDGGRGKLRLAVSVNAPNDTIRSAIMPINRAEPMADLRAAMTHWARRVLIEYVLIPGVNDADEHAAELIDWLDDLDCTVNVIPYNPRRDSPWPAPSEEAIVRFVDRLAGSRIRVRRRQTKGRDVLAACGQLGNKHIRRRRWVNMGVDRPTRTNTCPSIGDVR